MSSKIAIQGDKASFHDIAAEQFFEGSTSRVFCETFTSTFQALVSDEADYAVCAIENSLYGSINEVYDLLLKHKLQIVGEVYLRIEQCLIGLPGTEISDIKKVYSHPVALAQCDEYLDTVLRHAEREEYHDTAASAELIMRLSDPANAAIASKEAAELYELPVLAESIESNKDNYTRFVVISKQRDQAKDLNKTSLIVTTDHTPGALYNALGCFAKRNINLSKLQSRPIVGKAWHYMFFIDVNIGDRNLQFTDAVNELKSLGCTTTDLGSYLAGSYIANTT
jgi:prephenate dehydratase